MEYDVQAHAILHLVKVEMETSEGQCRGWEVRVSRCQRLASKNRYAQAGRQNVSTALGIKKPLCWTLAFISAEAIL